MFVREIILEYDRSRAAQVLGGNLWKAMLRDIVGMYRSPIDQLDAIGTTQNSTTGNLNQKIHAVYSSTEQQNKLALNALEMIEAADPSPNKKYTQWMARQFIISEPKLEDVTSTLATYVKKFDILNRRKKLEPGENDINRYKTARQLYQVMDGYPDPEEESDNKGSAKKVYEDNEVTVIIPLDQTAACRYGRQTRWCTAATAGTNYFDQYNSQGPLYIVIPKQPHRANEKYQLHFSTDSFMDENDMEINLSNLLNDQFPGLKKFFLADPKIAEYLSSMTNFCSDDLLQKISDDIWDIVQEYVYEVLADWEIGDDYYYSWLRDEGYIDDEGNMSDNAPGYLEYNPDAEQWYNNIIKYAHPDPDVIKEISVIYNSSDSVFEIENAISEFVSYQMRVNRFKPDQGGVGEFIRKKIAVVKDKNGQPVVRKNEPKT